MKIVCNSSVLITLDDVNILYVLKSVFREVFIPEAVRKEVFGRGKLPSFIKCMEISEPISLRVLESNLGEGESEAICLIMKK